MKLLRGIDVTDTHHGGMITTDPFGDIMFSDGVFTAPNLKLPLESFVGLTLPPIGSIPLTEELILNGNTPLRIHGE